MNRRTFPYRSPYDQPIYQHPVYRQNQLYNNPYEQMKQPTPFEYYAKPNQPENWPYMAGQPNQYSEFQQGQQGQQQDFMPSLLTQFQTADGQVDVQKMLSTVGQLANTVQQVSPVIKEIGAMINVFRK